MAAQRCLLGCVSLDGKSPPGETCLLFFWAVTAGGCSGGGLWGYKDSNSSSVLERFYKSDECAKSSKWLNYSNG